MRQAFSYASIPRSFMPGHCAMQSIWQCFPDHLRPKAKEVMACTSKLLMQQVNNDGTRLYNDGEIASYIIGGNWNQPLSAAIIPILAKFYNLSVVIKISGQPDDYVNTVPGQAHHVINWAAGHYFVRKRGGAISKFDGLIDKLIEVVEGCDDTIAGDIIELSAAPGYLLNEIIGKFDTKGYPCYYHAGIYTGVGSARFTQNLDSIKYQKYSDRFDNIFGTKKFDYIISDAASAVNTEALVKRAVEFAGRRLNKNGTLVIKTFADPHCVYEFATKFAKVECCDGAASERYFILYNFSGGDAKADFYEIYDRFHRDLTDHSYSFSGNDVLRYYEHHFKEFRKFKPMLDILPNRQYAGSFKAITGFASASKTTKAVKLYPSAKFVAPTSELSLRHNKDFGVASFTPHVLFSSNIHDGDTIVIDELSQFCVEFVAMLKIFRNVNVVVVGDVYQTSGFDLERFTSFDRIGLINNMLDVYKIPKDICASLNKKFGWNIRTHSDVERSLYRCEERKIGGFINAKAQFICFNNSTNKELISRGCVSSTVTTYTGSRNPLIVLYVDAAAVVSKYINNTHATYTAITRATNKLILMGETDMLEKFYNFDNTMIDTYSEISKVIVHNDTLPIVPDELPLEQPVIIAEDVPSITATQMAIDDIVKPYSKDADITLATQVAEVPVVSSGKLKTNTAAITPFPVEDVVYRVTNTTNAVINQLSSNSVETIRTLVKRYSKKYASNSRKECKFAYNELVNGLMRALYGNINNTRRFSRDMKCTKEELMKAAVDYIESLDEKLGESVKDLPELSEIFDFNRDGELSFFNKRQVKFKAEDAFDMSNKAGQGVAACPKKVNLIYSAYARCMLDKIRLILTKNKRNIILATHYSEAQINDYYIRYSAGRRMNAKYTCNDFSEWDASFRKCFVQLTSFILRAMGADEFLIKWFEENRQHWLMIYRNIYGTTKLEGYEKQFSGNPFTIAENTVGNMSLCFAIFNYKQFDFALFKGDFIRWQIHYQEGFSFIFNVIF